MKQAELNGFLLIRFFFVSGMKKRVIKLSKSISILVIQHFQLYLNIFLNKAAILY